MLQLAISNTKHKLQALPEADIVEPGSDSTLVVAPRSKRSKLTSEELDICFASEKRRRIIYDDIRLPRPREGNIIYSAAEAINVVCTLACQNTASDQPYPERTFLVLVKEKMVNEKRVPFKKRRLNIIIQAHEAGTAPRLYWNSVGRPDIIPLAELSSLYC